MSKENSRISVIIPIYNAEEYLPSLFDAIETNTFFEGDEILLVDNGSTDNSVEFCRKAAMRKPKLYTCLSYSEVAGSYAARNYAVKRAKGDILVFTDSDCKPESGWIDVFRDNIKKGIVLAGNIQIEIENKGLWEHFDSLAHLNSEKNAKNNRVATANMAVLYDDFMRVGFFEKRFSGGDYEWSMRAVKNRMQILYLSNAVVLHPSRKTFEEILKKEQRIAYGVGNHAKIHKKSGFLLGVKYILKIFKIDTNYHYAKNLKKAGFSKKEIRAFHWKFMKIRVEQLSFAIKGYYDKDARKLGLK